MAFQTRPVGRLAPSGAFHGGDQLSILRRALVTRALGFAGCPVRYQFRPNLSLARNAAASGGMAFSEVRTPRGTGDFKVV